MKKIAIIGGGISGLTAAYTLEKQRRDGVPGEYVLYEASSRLGGVICTEQIDGCTVEAGPDSFLTEKSWAADFCRELGLGDQLIYSNDSARRTYVLSRGYLEPIPDGLMFLVPTKIRPVVFSHLFSWNTKLRMVGELSQSPRTDSGDESVASLVERHYGAEMVDRLADPLLSGIYGGNAKDLSVRAVLPRFAEMEQAHGSLGRAMLAARKKNTNSKKNPRPIFTSLKNGMQQMTGALLQRLPGSALRVNSPVKSLHRAPESWIVSTYEGPEHFDAIILATPAPVAAQLLAASSAGLAAELASIPYTSSITVALGYGPDVRRSLPPGFGFLVPRSEGKRLLAATFVHNKFPHRAAEDRALLRCFIAGENAEDASAISDEQIIGVVREELSQILRLRAPALFARVYRWKSAMAQYTVGHLDRLERIKKLQRELAGLALAGNGYRGIGIPDCIRSGQEAARQVLGVYPLPRSIA